MLATSRGLQESQDREYQKAFAWLQQRGKVRERHASEIEELRRRHAESCSKQAELDRMLLPSRLQASEAQVADLSKRLEQALEALRMHDRDRSFTKKGLEE